VGRGEKEGRKRGGERDNLSVALAPAQQPPEAKAPVTLVR